MGSNVAPPYANAFMDMIQQAFIFHCTLFNDHCTAWYRLIDDAFAIWTGDFHSLSLFNYYLNSLVPGLKFNMVSNSGTVPFLDTLLSIKDGHIVSDIYTKAKLQIAINYCYFLFPVVN